MEKKDKRGRPLGSGDKSHVILGIRVNEAQYNIVNKGLLKLKEKCKTKKKIILYLFKNYTLAHKEREIDELILKVIEKELTKKRYTEEEKKKLIRISETIKNIGIKEIFNN